MKQKREIPDIQVGICSGKEISFSLDSEFKMNSNTSLASGKYIATISGDGICLKNGLTLTGSEPEVILTPVNSKQSSFTIHAVTIGVNFHWERKEDQVFRGSIKLLAIEGKITIINVIPVEDYLTSVISSEMKATSSVELLKAHAVVSRSWLLAQIEKSHGLKENVKKYNTFFSTDDELIRWYDREDHKDFDVCADDHCQRYQGITRASVPAVIRVIEETTGEVLTSEGSICDTRYYKCCGGVTELFENVWEPVHHPYLQKVVDVPAGNKDIHPDLQIEGNAVKWILGNPEAFCNTNDKKILSQVLNDYDQETNDFFRWKVTYTQKEVSELVKLRTGIDFGIVNEITPLERGSSGRITRLKISGSLKKMVIGKELEIRKSLSASHLYSSCFVVEKKGTDNETTFTIHGAGWGHGVGLCQIGAAVMGSKGYKYDEILFHYFKNASLEKRY